MSLSLPKALLILMCVLFLLGSARAQEKAASKPELNLDFSKDPCGNPMMESQLFQLVEGRVSKIIDGSTVQFKTRKKSRLITVQLAGVESEQREEYAKKAADRLRESLLNHDVELLVNPSVWDKAPDQVIGVIHTLKGTETDITLMLLRGGLVRFKAAPPYMVSAYTECQYRHAEADARSSRVGLWQSKM